MFILTVLLTAITITQVAETKKTQKPLLVQLAMMPPIFIYGQASKTVQTERASAILGKSRHLIHTTSQMPQGDGDTYWVSAENLINHTGNKKTLTSL